MSWATPNGVACISQGLVLPRGEFVALDPETELLIERLPEDTFVEGSESVVPPVLIEMIFRRTNPAVRVRVVAAGPQICSQLYAHMRDHVIAGHRREVWSPETAASVGVVLGAAIPDVLLLAGLIQPWWTILLQFVLGAAGWYSGKLIIDRAFPPLELVEAWERSRWKRLKTIAWQGLTLILAVVSILVAVALSQPAPAPRPSSQSAANGARR
jgi:hypothetical protein